MFERLYSSLYNYRAFSKQARENFEQQMSWKEKTKKIGAFPSEELLLRLVVSIMININEEWITKKKIYTHGG